MQPNKQIIISQELLFHYNIQHIKHALHFVSIGFNRDVCLIKWLLANIIWDTTCI